MIFRADNAKKIGGFCVKALLAVLLASGGYGSYVSAASETDKAADSERKGKAGDSGKDTDEAERSDSSADEEKEEVGEDHGSDSAAWVRDMQNYLMKLGLADMPNLSVLISSAEKAEKNCTEPQRPAVKKVLENIKALAEILEQKPNVYKGSIQSFHRNVKEIVRHLPQLRLYTKACKDNEPYSKFVNYDWPALLANLNDLADKNILAELDDALTINNERDLANFVINSVQNLKDAEGNDFPKKETVIGVAKDILQKKMPYEELFKQVTRLAYLYNYIAYRYGLTILRVSHIRDVRDRIVDDFFDQTAKDAADIKDEILKLKDEYDVDTYHPAPIQKLVGVLDKAGLGNLAWQASQLFQAVADLDSKIEQIKKIYIKTISQQKK